MKSMNSFFTVLLCIALILTIFSAELLYCAHNTLMAPAHLSRFLESDDKLSQLTTLVYSGLSEPESSGKMSVKQYTVYILNKIDQTWVKSQVYIAATGLHKYICSQASTLPTLDFVPLKAAIKEAIASEIMKQNQTQEKIGKVKTILAVLSNKYFSAIINFGLNNQLVSMLLELAPIRNTGFDSTAIQEIIRIYLSLSNKDITLDQASYSIVQQMSLDALELGKLKDYFDMNLFLEKAFGANHPVLSFKTVVNRVDTSLTRWIQVLFWCFILLMFLNVHFRLTKLLKITFACTIIASALNLLLSALLINPLSAEKFAVQLINIQGAFGDFLVKVTLFLFRDFGLYLALQSVIAGVFASVLYLIIKFMHRKTRKAKVITHRFPTWRLLVVVMIFTLLYSWWHITAIHRDISNFHNDMINFKDSDVSQRVLEGLKEAGGMDFLKYLQK